MFYSLLLYFLIYTFVIETHVVEKVCGISKIYNVIRFHHRTNRLGGRKDNNNHNYKLAGVHEKQPNSLCTSYCIKDNLYIIFSCILGIFEIFTGCVYNHHFN